LGDLNYLATSDVAVVASDIAVDQLGERYELPVALHVPVIGDRQLGVLLKEDCCRSCHSGLQGVLDLDVRHALILAENAFRSKLQPVSNSFSGGSSRGAAPLRKSCQKHPRRTLRHSQAAGRSRP